MAVLEVIFGVPTLAQIGVLTLDASLEETHTSASEVTEHPVEEGTNISDHIRRLPETLVINGVVTNHPLFLLPSFTAPSPIQGDNLSLSDRVKAAYDKLKEIHDAGTLVKVVTSLRDYSNMAITGFSVLRNAPNGDVLNATISMREILTAKAEAPETPLATRIIDQGKKVTKAADDAVADNANKSLLATGFDFTTGLFK